MKKRINKGKQKIHGFHNRLAARVERGRKKQSFGFIILSLVLRFFDHGLLGKGAQLAYYFLFSFMPLIIFAASMLALLNLDASEMLGELTQFIPHEVLSVAGLFYDHIKGGLNITLMYTGLGLSIYFASSALRSLMSSLDVAYNVKKPRNMVLQFIISFFYAVIFLATIIASIVMMLVGGYLIGLLVDLFPQIGAFHWIIEILRYAIMIFPIFGILMLLYRFTPHRKLKMRNALPGALFSTFAWIGVSFLFSFYVTNFGNYANLYGSLGAIIVLMLWLYLTGIIFIFGGELNGVLLERRQYLDQQKLLDDGDVKDPTEE